MKVFCKKLTSVLIIGALGTQALLADAREDRSVLPGQTGFFVSVNGSDENPGTINKPFRTIQKAVSVMESGDTCYIREGRYSETVTVKDVKGQEGSPVVFRPYGNEKVVLDGSEAIEAKWSVCKGRIYKARVERAVRQLFVDGRSMCSARWPNGNWDDGSVWDKSKCMAWPEKAHSDFGRHCNKELSAFDFSLEDGGIVIVNSGSFRTYKAFVTEHKAGGDNFKYDTTKVGRHFGTYPVSRHGYFLEGKLGLLDVPGEWFYEPRDSMLYLWPLDGGNPNDLEIRGKVRSYAFDIQDSSYVIIKGLHFFGATFRSSESTHMTVEDCSFLYPSYSKRMLRDLSLIDVTKMTVKREFDPAHNTIRNCVFEYMDGPALKMNGADNVIENCYIHDVDYSCTYEGGWTINTVDSPGLVFRRNTVHTTGASELFKAGVQNVIEFNDLSRSGFLQNDGGLIQVSVKSQKDSITRFNWVHDSIKQGIRFDNSNKPGSPWGEGGRVHHNVAWKTERVFFKGDKHFICNNLSFGSRANDLIISSNKEINGFNYETVTRNNIAGTFSGHRTKPGRDYPVGGVVDHNWTADVKGKDIRTQLRDPDNLDFRPRAGSELVDSGVPMKGCDFPYVGKSPDIGPYEYGDENYWIPGRQWSEASRPVPPDGAGNVKLDADLMWLGGYRADSHDVYFGTDWKVVCSAGRTSRRFKGNQRNNIYGPGELEPKTTYYWRIDVMKDSSVVKGSVWSFTTGIDNFGEENKSRFHTYERSWESLNGHDIPEWLLDAKLGLYGHWGVYSVPAFKTEWYGRLMYDKQTRGDAVFNHHIEKYGKQSEFGYKDFIKDFKAEKFDPQEWADIITKSGAKYAGITVVHHDGFCLWDSKYTRWDAKDMGPKRDLYGELVAALRKADPQMKILTCFHHYRTYGWFYTKDKALLEQGAKEGWDIFDPEYADFYRNPETEPHEKFLAEWKNKVIEVIDNYQPDIIWFDGGGFRKGDNEPVTLEVLTYFYNTQHRKGSPVEVVNKKSNFHPDFGLRNFEKGGNRPPKVDFPWADDLNIANRGWCYTHDIKYRTPNQIIDGFVDRVSRGGGLMLSISPMADGTIPDEQKHILSELGKWLKINGDGIYGTRKWKIETEGPVDKLLSDTGSKIMWNFESKCDSGDIRFTQSGNTLYAFVLDWPANGEVLIKSLHADEKISSANEIIRITMLGTDEQLKWSRDRSGLKVILPKKKHCDYAYGFRIEVKGDLIKE